MGQVNRVIRSFDISSSGYTAIIVPVNCNFFMFRRTLDGSSFVESPEQNDTFSDTIPAGSWYAYTCPAALNPSARSLRWQTGDTCTFVKGTTTTKIVVEFST